MSSEWDRVLWMEHSKRGQARVVVWTDTELEKDNPAGHTVVRMPSYTLANGMNFRSLLQGAIPEIKWPVMKQGEITAVCARSKK